MKDSYRTESITVAAATHSLENAFGIDPTHSGIVLAVLLGLVFVGGIKRDAKVADLLVPVKTLAYVAVTLYVIVLQFDHVAMMLLTIIKSAVGLDQAFGGLIGSAIVMGVKRCGSANEGGLGSAFNVAAVTEVRLNRPWFPRHSPSSGNSVSHTLLETAA